MSVNSTSNYIMDDICQINSSKFIPFYTVRIILLLGLCFLVFYVGHQRWRQQRSFKTASHSDIFTYHMAAMELIWVLGCLVMYYGAYTNHSVSETVGLDVCNAAYCGEIFFHLLTCVERYLAVVHPITYMSLRNAPGVRIRNISIGCAWLLSFGLMGVTIILRPIYKSAPLFSLLAPSIIIISFCSVSVLCVLIRPRPGEGGGEKEMVAKSKQRALYTMTAITCALWVWFLGVILLSAIENSGPVSSTVKCLMLMCLLWLCLPSSLVLPLLYLHRTGKLSCCSYSNN